jgi:hypothetical protein
MEYGIIGPSLLYAYGGRLLGHVSCDDGSGAVREQERIVQPFGGPPHKLALWEKVFGVALLSLIGLFLLFDVDFHFAPWEIAYRQRGLKVMRTELAALPTVDGVTEVNPSERADLPRIITQYLRTVACEEVFAHYRQVAPAAGWTVLGSVSAGLGNVYTGMFDGYYIQLEVGCDESTSSENRAAGSTRYELLMSVPFPHNIKGLPW